VSAGADRLTRIEDAVMELVARTSTMQATLEAHIRQQTERTARRDQRCTDHETRIRDVEGHDTDDHEARIVSLERWRWTLAGAAAVLGAGAEQAIRALAHSAG
jgi:hypothetical protein